MKKYLLLLLLPFLAGALNGCDDDEQLDPEFFYETFAITRVSSSKMEWKGLEPNSIKDTSIKFLSRSKH
ncbi:MAG: hypothetical protein K2L28_08370 [Muribaculaceae bacterium]|nr:hypothetical protein [Muribaculaceae bacterium]